MVTPTPADAIELRSDNAAGVAPEILRALAEADDGSALAYGGDSWTERLHDEVRRVFDHPTATVHPVVSGTAANALALSTLTPPWGAVLCHDTAHILRSEAGATSMFGGGAVMQGLAGEGARIDSAVLAEALATAGWGDPHNSQPAVLSLTCPTDRGTVYRPDQVLQLATAASERGLRVHVDGARLANAVAALDCSPADLTWRSGVEVVSLGAIKNGGMTADAIVSFVPDASEALVYRLKRAGHVASKMRYQSAQLVAYLRDGLWLRSAGRANRAMARLVAGLGELGVEPVHRAEVNMAFLVADRATADRMEAAGLLFHRMGADQVRFVTSFRTSDHEVDQVLERLTGILPGT